MINFEGLVEDGTPIELAVKILDIASCFSQELQEFLGYCVSEIRNYTEFILDTNKLRVSIIFYHEDNVTHVFMYNKKKNTRCFFDVESELYLKDKMCRINKALKTKNRDY